VAGGRRVYMSSVVWLLESAADTLGYQPGYIPTYPERVKNPKKPHFGILMCGSQVC
jgi:hypothetical protein